VSPPPVATQERDDLVLDDPAVAARRRYFPAVEGMRGVAALLVLGGHFVLFSHPADASVQQVGFWVARFGVVIFFGISGFLLYRPFLAARGSGHTVGSMTPSFLGRRAVRILPAYWVALTLAMFWPGFDFFFEGPWWAYYGLLQIYDPQWFPGGLLIAWTLCVEVTFYLLLPLLAAALAGRGAGGGRPAGLAWEVGALGSLALLSVAVAGLPASEADAHLLSTTLAGTFSWFVWGMLLAVVQVEYHDRTAALSRFLARPQLCWPLGIALFALVPLTATAPPDARLPNELLPIQVVLLGLAAALLLAPATLGDDRRPVRVALSNRAMVYAGTISYGIYLYHYPLVRSLLDAGFVLDSGHPVLVAGVLVLLGCVVLASASWYLVERPLMRRARSGIAIAGRRRLPG
jgi:peptidoglycan/LPS O-acetylase OafA/YrhL